MRPPHEESIIGGRWTGKKTSKIKMATVKQPANVMFLLLIFNIFTFRDLNAPVETFPDSHILD